jgi:hypothetical protein
MSAGLPFPRDPDTWLIIPSTLIETKSLTLISMSQPHLRDSSGGGGTHGSPAPAQTFSLTRKQKNLWMR